MLVIDENTPTFKIQPRHIDTRKHFYDSFNSMERETSARWIVKFCGKAGEWVPFTNAEIETFYNAHGHKNFYFNGLDENYIVRGRDGKYRVTYEFVLKCFESSPTVVVRMP